jgi:hypothetical protein
MDPYVTIRTSYGLWRYSAIQNGRRDVEDLPEFEAIPEEPMTPEEMGPGGEAANIQETPDAVEPTQQVSSLDLELGEQQ